MAFCNECGAEIVLNNKFCNECGKPVVETDAGSPVPVSDQAAYDQPAYDQPATYDQQAYDQPAYDQTAVYDQQAAQQPISGPAAYDQAVQQPVSGPAAYEPASGQAVQPVMGQAASSQAVTAAQPGNTGFIPPPAPEPGNVSKPSPQPAPRPVNVSPQQANPATQGVISIGGFVGMLILFSIPIIGWIICIIVSIAAKNRNRRNFARAMLIITIIMIVISVILYFVVGWIWEMFLGTIQGYIDDFTGGLFPDFGDFGGLFDVN